MSKQTTEEAPIRIVIGGRGWVWVGRFHQDGDEVRIEPALSVHRYGQKSRLGLGAHCAKLKRDEFDFRPITGAVRLHRISIVATYDCSGDEWAKLVDGGLS